MVQIVERSMRDLFNREAVSPKDIIRLAMWARFSYPLDTYRQACIAASASYVEQILDSRDVLWSDSAQLQQFTWDLLLTRDFTDWQRGGVNVPMFDLIWHESSPGFHDCSEIADAIHFLLWYKPATSDKRYQASLNRAYYYLAFHGFRGKSLSSWRSFLALWFRHRNALGFIYAAEYLVDEQWVLDPMCSEFRHTVDSLCDREKVFRFLANVKAVDAALAKVLHHKTRARITSPQIPAEVQPAELEPVLLKKELYVAMAEYEPESAPSDGEDDYVPGQL